MLLIYYSKAFSYRRNAKRLNAAIRSAVFDSPRASTLKPRSLTLGYPINDFIRETKIFLPAKRLKILRKC